MDCYAQAATRHLRDARLLFENHRFDNAVYLAGYVAECALKAMIELFDRQSNPRKYGHNLEKLQERVVLMRVLSLQPKVQSYAPNFAADWKKLCDSHPDRRYWATGRWQPEVARDVLDLATKVYKETLEKSVLDGYMRRSALG